MAWIRTAVSLYTFGFSISKFFDYLAQQRGAPPSAGPQILGIALVCMGILVLLLAVVEFVHARRKLVELGLPYTLRFSLPVASAIVLVVIGIVALMSIILHWPL
jgi:putative membrane protein